MLMSDNHTAFSSDKVAQALAPNGTFLTQQVRGRWAEDLLAAGLRVSDVREWTGLVAGEPQAFTARTYLVEAHKLGYPRGVSQDRPPPGRDVADSRLLVAPAADTVARNVPPLAQVPRYPRIEAAMSLDAEPLDSLVGA